MIGGDTFGKIVARESVTKLSLYFCVSFFFLSLFFVVVAFSALRSRGTFYHQLTPVTSKAKPLFHAID